MAARKHHPWILLGCILALSGAGAWISGELVKQHAALWSSQQERGGLFARMCQAAEIAGFSCKEATNGAWSRIEVPIPLPSLASGVAVHRMAVPVAFLGLAYFVFMGIWFAFVGGARPYGRGWHRVPLSVGLCAVVVSLFYLGLMASGSAPWCLGCLAVHAVNFLLVLAVWRLYRRPSRLQQMETLASSRPEQVARMVLTRHEATNAIAFSLIIIVGLWFYRGERIAIQGTINKLLPHKAMVAALQEDSEFLLREYYAQPQRRIPPRPSESIREGQAQLVLFTDFECPSCYCKALSVHKEVVKSFDGKLTVMVRHYPLCNACNDHVEIEFHRNACDAAHAAEAARLVGGDAAFWRMYALLYKNRKKLGGEIYRKLAVRIGLDGDQFIREMKGDTVRRVVQSDVALAGKLGVTGTPVMFLNGRRVTKLCESPVFWNTIAQDATLSNESVLLSLAERSTVQVPGYRQPEGDK